MQLTTFQLVAFVAAQVLILSTCITATVAAYRKSRQEPSAEWAAALRESISGQIEAFRSMIHELPKIEGRLTDLSEKEKRHFMSLSKQIRDLHGESDDEEEDTAADLIRMFAQQQRPRVAPQPNGTDIPARTPIPGLRQDDPSDS